MPGDDNASANKKRKASVSYGHYNHYKGLNTSMIQSKFLSNPEDLGVVAVGFSGGQVRIPPVPNLNSRVGHFQDQFCVKD